MQYYSLNKQAAPVSFREATISGQAPDKGLYFPELIPTLERSFIDNINDISNEEIAYRVILPFIGNEIPEAELKRIVAETINFEIPLVPVTENISALELYHGPTLAFKDIGARFMSRCLGYFMQESKKEVTVLVATSGDTGGAVANGFFDIPGIEVVILYPKGKVSRVQEQQLTTMGRNISALEVNGNFDNCQQMVKQAFIDIDLNKKLFLTSANSINVARWLPQQFYYFFAWKQWADKSNPPVICVPSGNFGNICAGLLAHISGLPVKHFIAACNANKTIPEFLQTEKYQPRQALATISNAMDVGDPSNFVRILELFQQKIGSLKKILTSYSISDEHTIATIKKLFSHQHYLTDPHGAVAFNAVEQWLQEHPADKAIFLETAHPVKFFDVVEPLIGKQITIPDAVQAIMHKEKIAISIEPQFRDLKDYLMNK